MSLFELFLSRKESYSISGAFMAVHTFLAWSGVLDLFLFLHDDLNRGLKSKSYPCDLVLRMHRL